MLNPTRPSKTPRPGLKVEALEDRAVPAVLPTSAAVYELTAADIAWMENQISLVDDAPEFDQQWLVIGGGETVPGGVIGVEDAPALENASVWQFRTSAESVEVVQSLRDLQAQGGLQHFYPLLPRDYEKRALPDDEFLSLQWHLQNVGQTTGLFGIDANVAPAWEAGYTGEGVTISVLDDGVQLSHPDLAPNLYNNPNENPVDGVDNDGNGYVDDLNGWDFNDDDNNPTPDDAGDAHGTAVGGVSAGTGNNGEGITGAAYNSSIVAARILGGALTDVDVANALLLYPDVVDVSNNSWGFAGPPGSLVGVSPVVKAALLEGATSARDGKGIVYVWAAGNGRQSGDNTNYFDMENSRQVLNVVAINHEGTFSSYSVPGAANLVTAPSNDLGVGIVTADLTGDDGYNDGLTPGEFIGEPDYTQTFGGTSSAAPLAAGVIALVLEANPELSYRDVSQILAETAVQVDPDSPGWITNGADLTFNHDYGFGMVDAEAATALAETWENLPTEYTFRQFFSPNTSVPLTGDTEIPDFDSDDPLGGSTSVFFEVTDELNLEVAELTFFAEHTYPNDLRIELVSPAGTVSVLAETRLGFGPGNSFENGWTFLTQAVRGESSVGTWELRVSDGAEFDVGTIEGLTFQGYGTLPGATPGGGDNGGGTDDDDTGGGFIPGNGDENDGETNNPGPANPPTGVAPVMVSSGLPDGRVIMMDSTSGGVIRELQPFGPAQVTVKAAATDLNGDGIEDMVFVPGPGGATHLIVQDGATGSELASFFAFDPAFRGGSNLATGDVTGDGIDDIVLGADAGGGPRVTVVDGRTFQVVQDFMAFDVNFNGGVDVAVGDFDGDGRGDVIAGAGAGGTPAVRVFSGATNAELANFFAYDAAFNGGVSVASGDFDGDGLADVVTGAASNGGPHVKVFSARTGAELLSFMAMPLDGAATGVDVAVKDTDKNGDDEIVVGAGVGRPGRVRTFNEDAALIDEFFPFGASFFGGVNVG